MSIPTEQSYADGFSDGQEMILDELISIIDDADFDSDYAFREVKKFINDKKKEIESL